eukprot:7625128-Ditylum_brightwellii.AAC.1
MNIKVTDGHSVNMNINKTETESIGSKRKTDSEEGGKPAKKASSNKEDKTKEVTMEEGNEADTIKDERDSTKK